MTQALLCRAINKVLGKNGGIAGYLVCDTCGNTKTISSAAIKDAIKSKKAFFVNLKVTSNGRLINENVYSPQFEAIADKIAEIAKTTRKSTYIVDFDYHTEFDGLPYGLSCRADFVEPFYMINLDNNKRKPLYNNKDLGEFAKLLYNMQLTRTSVEKSFKQAEMERKVKNGEMQLRDNEHMVSLSDSYVDPPITSLAEAAKLIAERSRHQPDLSGYTEKTKPKPKVMAIVVNDNSIHSAIIAYFGELKEIDKRQFDKILYSDGFDNISKEGTVRNGKQRFCKLYASDLEKTAILNLIDPAKFYGGFVGADEILKFPLYKLAFPPQKIYNRYIGLHNEIEQVILGCDKKSLITSRSSVLVFLEDKVIRIEPQ